jgi:hypothetical protein
MAWFDNFCRKYISEGLSLMAFDTDTNELVGVSIATECKRESKQMQLGRDQNQTQTQG